MSQGIYPYLSLLAAISFLSIYQWRRLGRGERYVATLIVVTLVEEVIAALASRNGGNNLWVYHLYGPVEFALISLYFHHSIVVLRKRNIGLYFGLAGIIISVTNTLFFQQLTSINSNFLLFESCAIIVYCLFSFYQILMDEERKTSRFALFWITACFMLYWSATFTGWGLYNISDPAEFSLNKLFGLVLRLSNFIFYLGLSTVFLMFKKLIPSGA